MSSYGNTPQDPGRQRRVERYAGEFLNAPSMSAPQPIPDAKGRRGAPTAGAEATVRPAEYQQTPAVPGATAPQAVRQDWSQPYAVPPGVQPDWSQQYAAQVHKQHNMTQQYPAMPGTQPYPPQAGTQQYPVQSGTQQYPPQPGTQQYAPQQGWSQPYAPQPGQQGWSQPYAPQPGAQQWLQQPGTQQQQPAPQGPMGDYAPPVPPPDHGGNDGSGNWWKLALVAVLLVAIVTGAVIGGLRISQSNAQYEQVSAYNDRFCEGVYVDGIHLGGMTQQEAVAVVEAHAQEQMASWSISLTYGGQLIRRITADDLGMTVNVNDALAEAWKQGHESSNVAERKAAMRCWKRPTMATPPCPAATPRPSTACSTSWPPPCTAGRRTPR